MSPRLPIAVVLAITVLCAGILVLCLRQARGAVTWFLLIAVWLRVMSGAFHQFTFAPVVGGLSINALLSVTTVMVGLAVIPLKTFRMGWAVPIYLILVVIVLSSLLNRTISGMIDMSFKWGYVLVMIAAIARSIDLNGQTRTLTLLMYCYLPLLIFQLASRVLGIAKAGEADGSASYIGGYYHEATFSVMVVTFAALAFFARGLRPTTSLALIVIAVLSIMLANYRTAILAILPLLAVAGFFAAVGTFKADQRRVIAVLVLPVFCAGFTLVLLSEGVQERFGDLFNVLGNTGSFIKPRAEFSEGEEKVLSGRMAIWASYIEGYLNGQGLQWLLGQGPNSWYSIMSKYAHNTVVSFLYELGPIGVGALLLTWGTFLGMTLNLRDRVARTRIMAAQIGFFILNMATMPHWQIEGNIMFAAIQACLLSQIALERQGRLAGDSRLDISGARRRAQRGRLPGVSFR